MTKKTRIAIAFLLITAMVLKVVKGRKWKTEL